LVIKITAILEPFRDHIEIGGCVTSWAQNVLYIRTLKLLSHHK